MFVSSLSRGEKNAIQRINKYSDANTVPRYFFVSWLALVTHAENALVLISPALGERHLFFSISFPFPQLYIHILGFSSPSLLIFQQVLLIFFKMGRYGGQRNCTRTHILWPQVLYTCRYIAQQNVHFSTAPVQQQKLIHPFYPSENNRGVLQSAISSTTLGTFSSRSGLGSDTMCPSGLRGSD